MFAIRHRFLSAFLAAMVTCGPQSLYAQQNTTSADENAAETVTLPPVLKNVELTPDRVLKLQAINSEGHGIPGVAIVVTVRDVTQTLTTDEHGHAQVRLANGGVLQFQIGSNQYACRTWLQGTAPPHAIPSIGLVDDSAPVMRGNSRRNDCCPPQQRSRKLERSYGLGILALGGAAAYMALSRDNASD